MDRIWISQTSKRILVALKGGSKLATEQLSVATQTGDTTTERHLKRLVDLKLVKTQIVSQEETFGHKYHKKVYMLNGKNWKKKTRLI